MTGIRGRAEDEYAKARVLNDLLKLWLKHPSLRLGQLILNVGDTYYVEDEKMVPHLEEFYANLPKKP